MESFADVVGRYIAADVKQNSRYELQLKSLFVFQFVFSEFRISPESGFRSLQMHREITVTDTGAERAAGEQFYMEIIIIFDSKF